MTTALLLMDLQNSIVERYGAADSYLDRVVAAQERAEQAGLLVVLVRVRFAPGRPEVSPRNKMFARVGTVGADDRGSEPHDRLLRGRGEVVVTKKRVSAFAGSGPRGRRPRLRADRARGPLPRCRRRGAPRAHPAGLPAAGRGDRVGGLAPVAAT